MVLLILDWQLALATLTVFPGMSIATALYRHYSAIAYRRTRERLGEVTATCRRTSRACGWCRRSAASGPTSAASSR